MQPGKAAARRRKLTGAEKPRIAPPVPARSKHVAFRETAEAMGIELMPWQGWASRYITATRPDGLLLFREVCIVVARQNGKTTLMKPYIIRALRAGKRVMHLAQNRELPRIMFGTIADALSNEPELFPKRRGRTIWPRYGSGQEEIALVNEGSYRIAAASRGGARGHPNDIVIIDELREMESDEVIGAAEPTLTMSADPQMIYLSNAGTEASVVLNAVRERAGKDESLAYLEWSAKPERTADDREGWAEANPALGHYPQVARNLEAAFRRYSLSRNLAGFETEHLCRWVITMRQRLVDDYAWANCQTDILEPPKRPVLGISVSPEGTRVAAVLAWRQSDDTFALRVLHNITGNPVDLDALGPDLRRVVSRYGVSGVVFDPLTDAPLARFFPKPEPVSGQKFANATERFVHLVNANQLRWTDADAVSDDLTWTASKLDKDTGSFQAVRASDEHPIPAALAAIRAVWLASGPKPPAPRVF